LTFIIDFITFLRVLTAEQPDRQIPVPTEASHLPDPDNLLETLGPAVLTERSGLKNINMFGLP
jgi:hypothetical protein